MVKIFWDKGHGGTDPGAMGFSLKEKQLVSKIVDYAMAYMAANYEGFEQRASRNGDETLSLTERTKPKYGDRAISPTHLDKFEKGQLSVDDAIGLIYVALNRGILK